MQGFRDLFVRELTVLTQQEYFLFFGSERPEGRPQPLHSFVFLNLFFRRKLVGLDHRVILRQTLPFPPPGRFSQIPPRVQSDPEDPGLQVLNVRHFGPMLPAFDKSLLQGIAGVFQVADQVFLTGEFQTVEYDDTNVDLDQIRLGAGFGPGMSPNNQGLYGRVEYVNFEFDPGKDDDGVAGAIGYGLPLNPQFRVHGEVGYLYMDDADGPELLIGATYRIAQNFGVFADYRISFLEFDGPGNGDVDVSDLRAGVRFTF